MKSVFSISRAIGVAARPVREVPCSRCFTASAPAWSGHSKWASIKHDKGKADANKAKQRNILTRDISNAVKLGGPNAATNPRLTLTINTAKKAAVPKAAIEAAIARGQGLSASGAALESITLETLLPPGIATVIEAQTDKKLKLLSALRLIVKDHGGAVSSIAYMFEKKGRISFQQKDGVGAEEVLEPALEMGVLDVEEDEQGRVIVFTEPSHMLTTAESLSKSMALEIEDSEIIFDPSPDTLVPLENDEAAEQLDKLLVKLLEVPGVTNIYTNFAKGAVSDDLWEELRSRVAV